MPAVNRCAVDSCLAVTGNYFSWDRLWHHGRSLNLADKVCKLTVPVLDAVAYGISDTASETTLKEFSYASHMVKTGRDVMSFFNVLNGVLIEVVHRVKLIAKIIENLCSGEGEDVQLKEPKKDKKGHELPLKYNQIAVGPEEKWAALAENFGKTVGGITYAFGFTVCKPIANVDKHIKKDNIHPTAKRVGQAFPTVMMVNHIGGVIGSAAGLVYQDMAFRRECARISPAQTGTSTGLTSDGSTEELYNVRVEYNKKMFENGVGLVEKSLELVADIIHHAEIAAPPAVRLPLAISIGVLSVTKAWIADVPTS